MFYQGIRWGSLGLTFDATVSEARSCEDRILSRARRLVPTRGLYFGRFGICGWGFTFLAALFRRETDLPQVSKGVRNVFDKNECGRRRTGVFRFNAKFNAVRANEIYGGRSK